MTAISQIKPDRSHIRVDDEAELKYWLRHLNVTREELQRAINKVGDNAAAVRKQLKQNDPRKHLDKDARQ